MTKFIKENYKNHLEQTISPGDEVVMVTTGYGHNVNIRKGIYLGKRIHFNGKFSSVTCSYYQIQRGYKLNRGHPDRYKPENISSTQVLTKTNLPLGRIYKLDTKAWDLSV